MLRGSIWQMLFLNEFTKINLETCKKINFLQITQLCQVRIVIIQIIQNVKPGI